MCMSTTDAFFGGGKKKKEEDKKKEMPKGKDAVAAGMDSIRKTAQDPRLMKDAMEALQDPETMKEVQQLMNDPEFIKEMERIKSDPQFANAVQSAKEMYSDPEKAAQVLGQLKSQSAAANGAKRQPKTDAQLGLQELAKTAANPKMLADAMEMLKDPETATEVRAMMNDPAFQAEMQTITESAQFKDAMGRAAQDIEALSNDPATLKKLKAKAEAMA